MSIQQNTCSNVLVRSLSAEDFSLFANSLKRFDAGRGDMLAEPGVAIEHVYLPETGMASVPAMAVPQRVEIGVVGREGFVGLPVLLSDSVSAHSVFVQLPGTFLKLPADTFRSCVRSSPTMLNLFLRYVQAYVTQVSDTAVANGKYTVESRLARWLLMAADRSNDVELQLTHEILATMLGVRRPGVTVATHVLEGEHAIRATRGRIRVTDRTKLRTYAGPSYGFAEDEYERLIGATIHGRDPARAKFN